MSAINTIQIYVGTYAKYNNGSIFGKWLDPTEYHELAEFYEACRELHADETDPEFMFQDHEGIPERFISESHLSEDFYAYREVVYSWADSQVEALETFIKWMQPQGDIDEMVSSFEDSFEGEFDTELDFTYHYIEYCGYLSNVPDTVANYFDYEKFNRDLFMSDFTHQNGFVFRNI